MRIQMFSRWKADTWFNLFLCLAILCLLLNLAVLYSIYTSKPQSSDTIPILYLDSTKSNINNQNHDFNNMPL